jgi:hypothetical protein
VCAGVLLPASSADAFQRGFTITGWSADSYLAPRSDDVLTRMAGDGSTHAAVFTQWFMDSPTSSSLAPDAQRTPSDASILHAAATARAAGMAVTIKPQIGIRTGNWIGYAHPADLDAFWADYRAMLLHYADLAEQSSAEMLVIGTEMATLSGDEAHWRPLIAEVRQHFHGKLTYAANYDEFARVPFWDALDYVGIDAYFSLADSSDPAPSADALASAWTTRGYLAQIAAVSRRTGKQVLFTELGYRGVHSTAVHPNEWNAEDDIDVTAQAAAYSAFYQAVADQPWMAGVYWWGIESDNWWVKDYSPVGKPAEDVMAAWNKRPSTPPPPSEMNPILMPAAPAIEIRVVGRRVVGSIARYRRECGGRVGLRLRRKSHGRWRYVRPPRLLVLNASGRFSQRLRQRRLRVRAVFSSRCGRAASGWTSAAH